MGLKTPTTLPRPAAVELHIEELVLHGFPAGDRFRIGDAVEQELVRIMSAQSVPGLLAKPASIARLDGGEFKVASGAKPQTIGTQVAQSVHHQFSLRPNSSLAGRQVKGPRTTR